MWIRNCYALATEEIDIGVVMGVISEGREVPSIDDESGMLSINPAPEEIDSMSESNLSQVITPSSNRSPISQEK